MHAGAVPIVKCRQKVSTCNAYACFVLVMYLRTKRFVFGLTAQGLGCFVEFFLFLLLPFRYFLCVCVCVCVCVYVCVERFSKDPFCL